MRWRVFDVAAGCGICQSPRYHGYAMMRAGKKLEEAKKVIDWKTKRRQRRLINSGCTRQCVTIYIESANQTKASFSRKIRDNGMDGAVPLDNMCLQNREIGVCQTAKHRLHKREIGAWTEQCH